MAKVGAYTIGTSTPLESNKSLGAWRQCYHAPRGTTKHEKKPTRRKFTRQPQSMHTGTTGHTALHLPGHQFIGNSGH